MTNNDEIYNTHKETAQYWYNKSSDLRASAGVLWLSMDDKITEEDVEQLNLGKWFDMKVATSPVYRMLCGMSLELLYKSIVVANGEEPNTKSHFLFDLAKEAKVNVTNSEKGLLKILSESIIWEGRYPVPQEKQKQQMDKLETLARTHLFEKESIGNINILKPNKALNWESFNNLWNEAAKIYWTINSEIVDGENTSGN